MTAARTLAILLYALMSFDVSAERDMLNYLYKFDRPGEIDKLPSEQQPLLTRIATHASNTEYDTAISLSQSLLDSSDALQDDDPTSYGKLLTNHAILLGVSGQYADALPLLASSGEYLEQQLNRFSPGLIGHAMATGITLLHLSDYAEDEDSFRRAQHLAHRQGGVYAAEQLATLNYITHAYIHQGKPQEADREQRFTLRISEHSHGRNSPALLPTLASLGNYYATRVGSMSPSSSGLSSPSEGLPYQDLLLKQAITMRERAIGIVESEYGAADLRLLEPLRGLASTYMLLAKKRKHAEPVLWRALQIATANPNASLTNHAQALTDLGDFYTVTANKRAGEQYLQAWNRLQESAAGRQRAEQLFSTPVRLHPPQRSLIYLSRRPDAADEGDELFVELRYAVGIDGKVQSVEVLNKNVPNENVRLLRTRIRTTRFRPRITDGALTPADGLVMRQLYKVRPKKAPSASEEPSAE